MGKGKSKETDIRGGGGASIFRKALSIGAKGRRSQRKKNVSRWRDRQCGSTNTDDRNPERLLGLANKMTP